MTDVNTIKNATPDELHALLANIMAEMKHKGMDAKIKNNDPRAKAPDGGPKVHDYYKRVNPIRLPTVRVRFIAGEQEGVCATINKVKFDPALHELLDSDWNPIVEDAPAKTSRRRTKTAEVEDTADQDDGEPEIVLGTLEPAELAGMPRAELLEQPECAHISPLPRSRQELVTAILSFREAHQGE